MEEIINEPNSQTTIGDEFVNLTRNQSTTIESFTFNSSSNKRKRPLSVLKGNHDTSSINIFSSLSNNNDSHIIDLTTNDEDDEFESGDISSSSSYSRPKRQNSIKTYNFGEIGDAISMEAGIKAYQINVREQFFKGSNILGLHSTEFIKAGTFLGRYKGKIITTRKEMEQRMKESGGHYVVDLELDKTWVCAKYEGNIFNKINHHCTNFNCKLDKIMESDGSLSIGVSTIFDIEPYCDLFLHYGNTKSPFVGDIISCLCKGINEHTKKCICNYKL